MEEHCSGLAHDGKLSSGEDVFALSDDESDGDVTTHDGIESSAQIASQLHAVLLGLVRIGKSRDMQRLCKNSPSSQAAGAVAALNVSHRARRIVDSIKELEHRFLPGPR